MTTDLSLKEIQKEWHGTLKSYILGFITCLLLTILSFSLVMNKMFSDHLLIYSIIALALMQAIVQLILFLHVGQEAKPRWETLIFFFMGLILIIVVIGSLWVMFDLNDRLMSEMHKEISYD